MIDAYTERFEHPYLLALLPIAGVFLGLSYAAELSGWQTGAGFLALYAMVALIICLVGYLAFFTLSFSTQTLRWWRYRKYRTD